MSGGIVDTSVLPDIANAGSTVLGGVRQGAGWLKEQFDQTSPNTQKWLLALVGLIGGAAAVNLGLTATDALTGSKLQGSWTGTALKWGIALAAMTYLSSDQSPLRTATNDSAPVVTGNTDPRSPWRDLDGDGRPDQFTPTREMRPALPTPG